VSEDMGIEVKHINKKFKNTIILEDINLVVETGELIALLGPSGSGKTSLLRIIAGLEAADSGHVLLDGEETETKPVKERKVGFVFQHYALFKHMTVFENAAFGLKVKSRQHRPTLAQIRQKIGNLLELMHLEGYENHYPHQLSGGQQQRVALVRSLAVDPKVLLLDEPFGALDAKVRKELCRWIRMLHDQLNISSILVTHDQEEALEVADRVCVMNKGKILQVDRPGRIWRNPANLFVFTFLGDYNEFEGWITPEDIYLVPPPPGPDNQPARLYARPHEIHLSHISDENKYFTAKIMHINSTGSLVKVELRDENDRIVMAEISHTDYANLALKRGDMVFIIPKKLHRFI
jgi:sulfate/thiosulfate transport system ATP-binding protein